jgi:N-carbamoyl-L-amino-acid hydrolase
MPSGAGHDAMKLHEVMPQAMLFVRGENAGISHNPLESTTADDMELAVQAMQHLLDGCTELLQHHSCLRTKLASRMTTPINQ